MTLDSDIFLLVYINPLCLIFGLIETVEPAELYYKIYILEFIRWRFFAALTDNE